MDVLLGPLLGSTLGFFTTLSKTAPMILTDIGYGAFLGLLFTVAIKLFLLSLYSIGSTQQKQQKQQEQSQQEQSQQKQSQQEQQGQQDADEADEDLPKFARMLAQFSELDQDRERLQKADNPIATRTRSQT